MKRTIYFEGELAKRYSTSLKMEASSLREVVAVLNANDPSFKKYLIECSEKNVGFECLDGNDFITEESSLLPLVSDSLIITPVVAGAEKAGQKILAAAAIALLIYFNPGAAFATAEGLTTLGMAAASVSINLALAGVQQMMAPDPATDKDEVKSYLFNGSEQNIIEGDPIPLLYGELKVPGRPISFDVRNAATSWVTNIGGELNSVSDATTQEYPGLASAILATNGYGDIFNELADEEYDRPVDTTFIGE